MYGLVASQFDSLETALPKHQIFKADQWIVLSYLHAAQIINLVDAVGRARGDKQEGSADPRDSAFFSIFKDMHASDEMFFPSILAVLGHIPHTASASGAVGRVNSSVMQRRVTYCDWSWSSKNPRTFASWQECCIVGATQASSNGGAAASSSSTSSSSSSSSSTSSSLSHFESARREGCLFMRKWKVRSTPAPLPPPGQGQGEEADNIIKMMEEKDELQEWVASVYEDRSSDKLNDKNFNIRALSSNELRRIIVHRTQTHQDKKRAADVDDVNLDMDKKRRKVDNY